MLLKEKKMNFVLIIQKVLLLKSLFLFHHRVDGHFPADQRSLIVTENDGDFRLTIPYKYDHEENKMIAYFKAPEKGNTYHFCPDYDKSKYALYKSQKVDPNNETEDINHCVSPIVTKFVKVENPFELSNSAAWNNDMELYHSGFVLNTKDLSSRNQGNINSSTITKIKYAEKWNSEYELLLHIEVFYNKKMKQTVAMKYELLSTTLPLYNHFFMKEDYLFRNYANMEVPGLLIYYKSDDYMTRFRKKINKKFTEEDFSLSMTQFASIHHFPILTWELASSFSLNLLPLWEKTEKNWDKVEKFALIVANNFGNLKVSTGITGIMSLSGEKVIDQEGFEMPNYLWKVFEYHKENKLYGILVILHCNPFEKTENKICQQNICHNNGWPISNDQFNAGEIYCCEMNEENIKNLNADYLDLKKREIFNLNNWEDKKKNTFHEFFETYKDLIDPK